MRVLYVAPRYHTNQVPVIKGWINAGDEVQFVSQFRAGIEDYTILEPITLGYSRLFTVILKIYKFARKLMRRTEKEYFFQALFGPLPIGKFQNIIKEFNPDIVILRDRSVYNVGVTYVCKKMKVPALLYTQSPLWAEKEGRTSVARRFFREHTPKVCMTPVLGRANETKTEKKEGMYYIPFVMEPYASVEEKAHFRNNEVNILAVGKFDTQKRHDMMLKLLEDLKGKAALHLTLVGEAASADQVSFLKNFEKYMAEHGLSSYVTIKTNLNNQQVMEEYKQADLFILPGSGEVATVSHLEAMSCSLPVICNDSSGTADYVEVGKNGYLFKDKDYNDLRNYVEVLVTDRDRLLEMGKKSYEIVEERHRFINYKKSIISILELLKSEF